MTVRTRVAPSPTGDPHVGTAYIALFNFVFARHHGGEFVLRIEDTDQVRSTPESEAMIFNALTWVGVEWDEGPDKGGDLGPYRQSERLHLYREHIDRLVEDGNAFYCFCTPDRLDKVRREQQKNGENPKYDGHCCGLDNDDVAARVDAAEPHVVRMKVPADGNCTFKDLLRGSIDIPWSQVDMQVLMKSDGFPTYHLAVVVDDYHMGITHVLRGEEWISSMPKHQLLYQYFGWPMPEHAHLPLLRNPDQSKLSKRKNPTSLNYFRRVGYLPEALLNYLALMGWSMPDEREIFSRAEMIQAFDLNRISVGGPIFDLEKLNWMNGQYVRSLPKEELIDRITNWGINRENLSRLLPLVQARTERLIDVLPQVDYLLGERDQISTDDFSNKNLSLEDCTRVLHHSLKMMDETRSWESEVLGAQCRDLAVGMGLKLRDFLFPLFISVAGRRVALPLFDSMAFLGMELTKMRVRSAIEVLGGISNKEAKRLDKSFEALELK